MCFKIMRFFALLLICTNINYFLPLPAKATNEGNDGYDYHPDNVQRSKRRPMPMNYVDAYGNSIFEEIEQKPREERIGAGAYGGYDSPKEEETRPLPDIPSQPKWSFK